MRVLSARSIERAPGGARFAVVLFCALLAAACSSTGSRRPTTASAPAGKAAVQTAVARSDKPDAAPVPEGARQSYARALAAMQAKDWTEAQLELKELLLEFNSYPGPYINLAIVYMHEGHDDDAMRALKSALALDPNQPVANNQMGILLRRQGRFKDSEQAYRRAIASDPNYLLAYYNLGVLLDLYLNRGAEALKCYQHYQTASAKPDPKVARWIIELQRRVAKSKGAEVAREDGS